MGQVLRPPCSSLAFGRSFLPPLSLSPLVGLRSPLVHSHPAQPTLLSGEGWALLHARHGGQALPCSDTSPRPRSCVAPCYRLRLHTSPLAPLPPRCLVVWGSLDVLNRMDRINVLRLILFACFLVTAPLRYAVTRSAMRE